MAIINVDDAYILNETGAQVDKTTGIPFKDESLTDAEAAQARANIRAGGTNPNLLDNPWFTVNQRGAAGAVNGNYGIDRWIGVGGGYTVNNDGSLNITGAMAQRSDWSYIFGKTVTISALLTNGNVYSWTGPMTTGAKSIGGLFNAVVVSSSQINFAPVNNLKALKLELGPASTLANDTPPDYGTELAKCQRYFTRLFSGVLYTVYGNAVAEDAGTALMMIPLPVSMRATPTSVVWNNIRLYDYVSAASISPSSVYAIRGGTSTPLLNVWCGVSPAMTAARWLTIQATNASAYIDISADL